MYKACAGGYSVSSEVNSPKLKESNALSLDVATVKADNKRVYLFVVNRALQDLSCEVNIPDFYIKSSSATILTAESIRSYNSFENPDVVVPKELEVNGLGENFNFIFPKLSLSTLTLEK